MQSDDLHLRNIFEMQFNVPAMGLCFKLLKNFKDILVNINAVGSRDLHYWVLRYAVEQRDKALFV